MGSTQNADKFSDKDMQKCKCGKEREIFFDRIVHFILKENTSLFVKRKCFKLQLPDLWRSSQITFRISSLN